jgi:hypothetical protein
VLSADDRERCIKRCYIPVLPRFSSSKTTTATHFAHLNSPLFLTHQPPPRSNDPSFTTPLTPAPTPSHRFPNAKSLA